MPRKDVLKIAFPPQQKILKKLTELVIGVHPENFLELKKFNDLHEAIAEKDLEKIARLLAQNSCVDQAAEDIETYQYYRPLNLAVKLNNIHAINLLLNLGASQKISITKTTDPLLQGALAFWKGYDRFCKPQATANFLGKATHPFEIAIRKNPVYMWRMIFNFSKGINVTPLKDDKFKKLLDYVQHHLHLKPEEIEHQLKAISMNASDTDKQPKVSAMTRAKRR